MPFISIFPTIRFCKTWFTSKFPFDYLMITSYFLYYIIFRNIYYLFIFASKLCILRLNAFFAFRSLTSITFVLLQCELISSSSDDDKNCFKLIILIKICMKSIFLWERKTRRTQVNCTIKCRIVMCPYTCGGHTNVHWQLLVCKLLLLQSRSNMQCFMHMRVCTVMSDYIFKNTLSHSPKWQIFIVGGDA